MRVHERGHGKQARARLALGAAMVMGAVSLGFSAVSQAAPASLHLTAYVYDAHASGGAFSSREKLFEGSRKVGEDYSRCTEVSARSTRCVGSYTLSQGTIQFSGTISTAGDTNRLSITGGTGSYKDVRGTVLTEYNRSGTKAQETLTFK
jgi:hypothetical protein